VFAHSWPGGHQFTYNNGTLYDTYYSTEYTNQNPPVNFYNFFACSFSRYTASGNCGGSRAIFNQDHGIGSIGSTKTGSMLEFEYFYEPLGQGANIGEAFKDWFTYITGDGVTFDELCWHYGMTLLADCYLIPLGHNTAVSERDDGVTDHHLLHILSNPVYDRIHATLHLRNNEVVKITLYSTDGRKVIDREQYMKAGTQIITIELRDRSGSYLPNGVYLLRVNTDETSITEKIVKIN
jgi:hypothetical protein